MRRLNKFLRYPAEDRRLLLRSAWLLSWVRLGLWLLPFRMLRRLLLNEPVARFPEMEMHDATRSLDRILWAVKVASRYVPRATCLTQALVAKMLLKKSGYSAELRIGIAKTDNGQLEAHAWVESDGKIVIGNLRDLTRYTDLPPLVDRNH